MDPEVYILRHGETVWNVEGRMQGRQDSPLTPLGRVQAARQGAILRRHGVSGLPCLASPLGRASLTARLAGLSATPDARLAEICMGQWEGQLRRDLTDAPGLVWKFDAPGGEGLRAVQDRLRGVLAVLTGPAILVTHGVLSIALRAQLRGIGHEDWDALTDPQGVVHHVVGGQEKLLR